MKADERDLAEFLNWVMDGEPLTKTRHGYQRRRAGREERIDRACWLRAEGWSYDDIGAELGVAFATVRRYIAMGGPALEAPVVGRRSERRGKFSDGHLRLAHRWHIQRGYPVRHLARLIYERVGYASAESAAMALTRGWQRLGLPTLVELPESSERRCSAKSRKSQKQCRRFTLLAGDYCLMHDPARRDEIAAHATHMREAA